MATYIATLLRVENKTFPKTMQDEDDREVIRDVTFPSNPEYACVPIDAKSAKDAEKQAKAILDGDLHGLGWTSYKDDELWGKEQRVLVDVVEEAEHVKRSGRGNQRGSEGQDARFERMRKAATV